MRAVMIWVFLDVVSSFTWSFNVQFKNLLSRRHLGTKFIHDDVYGDDDFNHILGWSNPDHVPSKLQLITAERIKDVTLSKTPIDTDGCGIDRSFYVSSEDLENDITEFDKLHGKPLNLREKVNTFHPEMAVAAEFKRASPSKGDINPNLDAAEQCLKYCEFNPAVISVLTEAKYFKGTLADMKKVRLATQLKLGSNRPAILRKDFIIDRYQVLEARANGADTILLIVAILGVNQLKDLIAFSRSLGMEPLVEVHTAQEMEIAVECGSTVIGINNRNLHTFQLDLGTTGAAIDVLRKRGVTWRREADGRGALPTVSIASLSGISSAEDVRQFRELGVACVLIGETLMKAADPKATVDNLLSLGAESQSARQSAALRTLVKICGLTSRADADVALGHGGSLLGIVFANSARKASLDQARAIVESARRYGERTQPFDRTNFFGAAGSEATLPTEARAWFENCANILRRFTLRQPLVVGVFQNQNVEEINNIIAQTGIDLVQLHGDESPEIAALIHAPCIRVLHLPPSASSVVEGHNGVDLAAITQQWAGKAVALLVDTRVPGSAGGGTGAVFDWSLVSAAGAPVLIAGGLTPNNVNEAVLVSSAVIGVDASSALEVENRPGEKDHEKIRDFIFNARK